MHLLVVTLMFATVSGGKGTLPGFVKTAGMFNMAGIGFQCAQLVTPANNGYAGNVGQPFSGAHAVMQQHNRAGFGNKPTSGCKAWVTCQTLVVTSKQPICARS